MPWIPNFPLTIFAIMQGVDNSGTANDGVANSGIGNLGNFNSGSANNGNGNAGTANNGDGNFGKSAALIFAHGKAAKDCFNFGVLNTL